MSEQLWGIDLGGTKIEGVVLPGPVPKPLARLRVLTEQERGYEHILEQIFAVVRDLEAGTSLKRPARIGLAMPGTIGSDGRVKNSNTVCLIGKALDIDLGVLLGVEIVAMNDANLFALAETRFGAAQGISGAVFGVIMGTGVGGGVVVDGKVLSGCHGIAGEWGHNILIPEGELCYCGKSGCVETVISGPALERWHEARSGRRLSLKEIAASPDADCQATIDRLCDYFGRSLATVVNILDPSAIILGGGVGNVDAMYTRGRHSLERWMFNGSFEGKLLRPELGDSAGVFGAALLTAST